MPHVTNPRPPPKPPFPPIRPDPDDRDDNRLARAISALVEAETAQLNWFKSHMNSATKADLKELEKRIMSAISEFAAKQNAHNTKIDTAVTGLEGDIKTLNDKITELQNNPGPITPEDQALLDEIEKRGEAIATKLDALDALTPPTPPPA